LHCLGVATQPITAARLRPARLSAAIRAAIENPLLTNRAAEIRERVAQDRGADAVVLYAER
jgi:hypothetical protein